MKYLSLLLLSSLTLWLPAQEYDDHFVDEVDEQALTRGENLARVTYADKFSFITREGEDETETLLRNMAVVSGDYLETRYNSYSEIEFIDGSLLQVANRSEIEFQAVNETYDNESLTVIKLHTGSVFLHATEVRNVARRVIRLDTYSGSVYVEAPGIYRVDMEGNRMRLRVYRGFAELSGDEESRAVYSGEYATIRNMKNPSRSRPFNSFQADRFESWAYGRRPVTDGVSSKYVDSSIASYSRDLDDNGSWRYDDNLRTHVWVPYVGADWAPYRNGFWGSCNARLSWTSYDPFGWVTHHYGRWRFRVGLGWYWIPGYYYSPGWVAWSSWDNYLGWCPLGYDNYPWYYYNEGYSYHPSSPRVRVHRTQVVVNNYWNYVPATTIINRRRHYNKHDVIVRGNRNITTRPIHVERGDFRDASRLTRVVRDVEVNRSRANARRADRGMVVSSDRVPTRTGSKATRQSRVQIENRSSGTRAVSRRTPEVLQGSGGTLIHQGRNRYGRTEDDANNGSRHVPGADRSREARTARTSRSSEPTTSRNATSSRTPTSRDSSERRYQANSRNSDESRGRAVEGSRRNNSERANTRTTNSRNTKTVDPGRNSTSRNSSSARSGNNSRPSRPTATPSPRSSTPTRNQAAPRNSSPSKSQAKPRSSSDSKNRSSVSRSSSSTRSNSSRGSRASSGGSRSSAPSSAAPSRSAPSRSAPRSAPSRSSSSNSSQRRH
jgi:hypothetical protein